MGKPLSRPDCLRQHPACLGKGEEEDGYIEDCYVPQRSIYDTMRINEQIDQGGAKLSQPSKTTMDKADISTLSSNGTLGTPNPPDAKSLEAKKLDERVIFDALKLSNDTLKSAPVPPRRRPNPDRKENVNRRSWKAFMPPNFPEFAERIEASLSEVSEAGTSNHSLHDQLLPENSKYSSQKPGGSVSSTSGQSRTPALSSMASTNQSLDHATESRCQHVQSFDYYNDSEYEHDPLIAQEDTSSLCPRSKPGHSFPSATWPRALKSFLKGSITDSHHKAADMAYEECIIETLPLSPCLSDEVLDESSDFLIVPNLRQKTESELKFEEDEQKILMEAEEEWEDAEPSRICSVAVEDAANMDMGPIDADKGLPEETSSTSNLGSLSSFLDDKMASDDGQCLLSEDSNQEEDNCFSAISAEKMARRRHQKLGSYSDSESDSESDQLFLELEQQCQTEDESNALQMEYKECTMIVEPVLPSNLHGLKNPELDQEDSLPGDECILPFLSKIQQPENVCLTTALAGLTSSGTLDPLKACEEVDLNSCPENITNPYSVISPEKAQWTSDTFHEGRSVTLPNVPGDLVEGSTHTFLASSSDDVGLPQHKRTEVSQQLNFKMGQGTIDLSPDPPILVYTPDSPICDTERDSCLGSSEQPDESWTCEASLQSTDLISVDSCDEVSDGGEMALCSPDGCQSFSEGVPGETYQCKMGTEMELDNFAEIVCQGSSAFVLPGGVLSCIADEDSTVTKLNPPSPGTMNNACDALDMSTGGGSAPTCSECLDTDTAEGNPVDQGLVEVQRDQQSIGNSMDQVFEEADGEQHCIDGSVDHGKDGAQRDQQCIDGSVDQGLEEAQRDQQCIDISVDQGLEEAPRDQQCIDISVDQGLEEAQRDQQCIDGSVDHGKEGAQMDQQSIDISVEQGIEEAQRDQHCIEEAQGDQQCIDGSVDHGKEGSQRDQQCIDISVDQGLEEAQRDQHCIEEAQEDQQCIDGSVDQVLEEADGEQHCIDVSVDHGNDGAQRDQQCIDSSVDHGKEGGHRDQQCIDLSVDHVREGAQRDQQCIDIYVDHGKEVAQRDQQCIDCSVARGLEEAQGYQLCVGNPVDHGKKGAQRDRQCIDIFVDHSLEEVQEDQQCIDISVACGLEEGQGDQQCKDNSVDHGLEEAQWDQHCIGGSVGQGIEDAQRDQHCIDVSLDQGKEVAQRDQKCIDISDDHGKEVAQRDQQCIDISVDLGLDKVQRDQHCIDGSVGQGIDASMHCIDGSVGQGIDAQRDQHCIDGSVGQGIDTQRDQQCTEKTCDGAGCSSCDPEHQAFPLSHDSPPDQMAHDVNSEISIKPNLEPNSQAGITNPLSSFHVGPGGNSISSSPSEMAPVPPSCSFLPPDIQPQASVPCSDLHASMDDCSEYSTASEGTPDCMSPIHCGKVQKDQSCPASETSSKETNASITDEEHLWESDVSVRPQSQLPSHPDASDLELVSLACAPLSDRLSRSVNTTDDGLLPGKQGEACGALDSTGIVAKDATDVSTSQQCGGPSSHLSSDEPALDNEGFQKEQVDSLQLRLQQVNGLGQGLIQSADKNCDVHGLEHDVEELNAKWNTLNKKVAERVTQLQEALLHCGKFQDALEPLLSWLTDTEDLIANQKPPSAEYKVVKAQIQEQKLLQHLLDDRRATVDMIQAEGARIAEGADLADKEKISRQLDTLQERWSSLLQKAQTRQKQLDDILVLAKQFHETTEPILDWLTATEKKLANSEPIGTQTGKIQQQIVRHKSLEEDIAIHEPAVLQADTLVERLSALCCKAEQDRLGRSQDYLHARYGEVQDLCSRKGALLGQALSNARLFGEDEVEVLNWLAEVEDKLSSVAVKDYKLEVLQKQHADQMSLSEEIVNRKRNVDQAVKNGQALLKQTTGEEVLLIQEKLDGIKTRYADIMASSGKALRILEQALQLASKFQTTYEELTSWLTRVEEELAKTSGQTSGQQIAQFQQRQKELKKEAMEYCIVLDTINEVGSALLELVPWRAREGLDKLVSDASERYKSVSATIGQRVDQIDSAIQRSQQYEQAADTELAWVAETRRKLLALGPICLEQDQTTAQLQVQKAFTVDIIRHKDSIDELISTQEEILGTCGDEQKASLREKTKSLLQQYEDVSHLNSERSARLERAHALLGQFWETYEELSPWIEEMQATISQLPPPAVDHEVLRQQQEEIRQLREAVAEHKPHIDKMLKIGPHLYDLNPEEGVAVQEKYTKAEEMYLAIKEEVRKMAMDLDDALAQASQFHDKIGPMLETLENMASRLRMPPLIPAEVEKIRDCISDNKNTLMELEKLQPSFEALKHRGEELISRSQGADSDPAAKDIQDKLDQLVFTWDEIKAKVDEREMKYLDVLELAEKFWLDMGSLLTTIKDTQDIVHDLESPGIDPSMIKQQIEAADSIKEETDGLHEELEFIRILGADLIFACGETEKPEVKKSLDEMNSAWENLKKTWAERLEKLRDAMSHAVQYQDTLQAMFDWLDNAVIKLCDMPPVGTDINTVKDQINEMKEFKVEVYQQQIEMEKLNHQGELMLKKAIDDTDRDIIHGPITELKHLWENLGEKITHRQHKLEAALLALGQFQHALSEVMSWLTHTQELLDSQKPISGDPKVIEVELAKHHVLKNDVLAHASTVQTVNKAGNELLESSAGDDANSLRTKLEKLNQLWEYILQKTDEREQQLDMALQQAQGFTGEIEDFIQWENKIESQLSAAKPPGGLPETAREQLQAHMELYAEIKSNEELYNRLVDKGQLMLLSRDEGTGSVTDQSVVILKRKWQNINNKMEERKGKLEDALCLATDFQNSLQDFINWLTQAEQSLNVAPPPSLILDTVLFQIDEHKIFVNEVNVHREQIIELDKTGNQLKFLSQKQDVVLIKNLLLSVQSRWEKVVQRSVDRGRSLDDARKRAKQFHEAWKKLIDWLEEAENHLDADMDISNDPDKIKLQLVKHKEFQKTLGSKQPVYDTTVRTGRALKEKASLNDDIQKLDHLLGEVRDKWDTVCGKSVERQHKLEEALLFSGQFMDALQALVDWLYKVEPQLAEDQPVHGDLDLVMNLMDAHKVFQKELGKRTSSVQALKRSARELLESSREDTTWVKVQLQELSTRWDTVCKLSVSKQTRLEQALKQAEEFRSTVHMLLEWLSEAEQTLRFRGALPDDAEALQSLIDVHKDFMKNVIEKQSDVNSAVSMGEAILAVCHPDCITTVKHWITIIRARFEEVLTWGNQHQQRLQAALSELLSNSSLLDELLAWIQWAETTLIQRDQDPMPQSIDQVKALISEHQVFMEEMTQKQPDVDRVTKTYKRKSTDPSNDKTRNRKPPVQSAPPVLPLLAQSETKNPRINQLSARWQQVWLLALERQRKLNDALDRLEELKEFANFDFDVWRKKYMRWMNHKKSRVMDFFRRIDKDQDGKITRQEFIDGILASKFPTTKLEMTAVADIFDGDGDGYIDYYEFVAALHPNKDAYRPTTDADKIEDEVTRQVAQCKCAKRFQVEQIGENKYRFFLGNQFGDSQQLRLVRILRSTVMVRVGGGWMALDEFLVKNDPCRARGRTNLELREKFILPEGVSQGMTPFRSRGRRSKPSSRTASPTRSSSSASQSNHSCTSVPSSPATPASGSKTPQHLSRSYEKPWLVNSKASTPIRGYDYMDYHFSSCEVTPVQSSKMKKGAIHTSRSSLTGDTSGPTPSGAKAGRPDLKKSSSRAGSRAGSRASSRRGSDASEGDILETQSACSDTSENSAAGGPSRRGLSKPSKIPTITKKTTSTPKTPGTKR